MSRFPLLLFAASLLAAGDALLLAPGRSVAARPVAPRALATAAEKEGEEEGEDRLGAGGRGGHAVRNMPELSEEEKAVQAAVMEHQRGAARLTMAEDARSLVAYSSGYAVLSTLSSQVDGYPNGALVGFAPDASGLPVFVFSAMSSHTKDR